MGQGQYMHLYLSAQIMFRDTELISYHYLMGHNTQHSGHMGQNVQTEKPIEIQPVKPTEVCGKVESKKND